MAKSRGTIAPSEEEKKTFFFFRNQLEKEESKTDFRELTLTPAAAMAVVLRPFWRLLTAVSVETILRPAVSVARAMALASACAVLFPAAEPQSAAWESSRPLTPARAASTSEQMIARRDMVLRIRVFLLLG